MPSPYVRSKVAVVAVAVAFVVAACSSTGTGADGAGDVDTVVLAISGEPRQGMNPIYLDVNAGNWPAFDGLVRYDAALDLEADLAASMPDVGDDGTEVTVSLRDDVTFHDGEPFTARDVVFTFEALMDPANASPLTSAWDLATGIADVEATGDHAVTFTLTRPDPAFLDKLTVGIAPAHLLAGEDLQTTAFNRAPVGTGAYRFVSHDPDISMTFEANPDHHRGAPNIERVIFRFLGDDVARTAALREGSIDAVRLDAEIASSFADDDDDYQLVELPSASIRQMTLPNTNPVLAERAVRQAISLATDRQAVLDGIEGGAGAVAFTPFVDGMPFHDPSIHIPHDPDEAERMLDAAGWARGDDGIRAKDGQRLAFTAMYLPGQSADADLALAFRADMAAIGIDVDVEAVDSPANEDRFDTDAWIHGVGMPYDPDLTLYSRYHSSFADDGDPSTNRARVNDPAIDAALDAGRSALGADDRARAYRDLQHAVVEDASHLHLVSRGVVVVAAASIGGLEPQPMGSPHAFPRGLTWNLPAWTLDD